MATPNYSIGRDHCKLLPLLSTLYMLTNIQGDHKRMTCIHTQNTPTFQLPLSLLLALLLLQLCTCACFGSTVRHTYGLCTLAFSVSALREDLHSYS
jgi:hypothetical protein